MDEGHVHDKQKYKNLFLLDISFKLTSKQIIHPGELVSLDHWLFHYQLVHFRQLCQ